MASSGLAVVCSSALCSGTRICLTASVYDGLADSVGSGWNAEDADTGGVVDGVQDCGSGGDYGLLADAFWAERGERGRVLDEGGVDGLDGARSWGLVVVQVL